MFNNWNINSLKLYKTQLTAVNQEVEQMKNSPVHINIPVSTSAFKARLAELQSVPLKDSIQLSYLQFDAAAINTTERFEDILSTCFKQQDSKPFVLQLEHNFNFMNIGEIETDMKFSGCSFIVIAQSGKIFISGFDDGDETKISGYSETGECKWVYECDTTEPIITFCSTKHMGEEAFGIVNVDQNQIFTLEIENEDWNEWNEEEPPCDWLGMIDGTEYITKRDKLPFAIKYWDGEIALGIYDEENIEESNKEFATGINCNFTLDREAFIHLVNEQEQSIVISSAGFLLMCSLTDFKPIWKVEGEVDSLDIDPRGITSRNEDCIYVADGKNKRVLEFSAGGKFQKTLLSSSMFVFLGIVYGVKWMVDNCILLVLHAQEDCTMVIGKFRIP